MVNSWHGTLQVRAAEPGSECLGLNDPPALAFTSLY